MPPPGGFGEPTTRHGSTPAHRPPPNKAFHWSARGLSTARSRPRYRPRSASPCSPDPSTSPLRHRPGNTPCPHSSPAWARHSPRSDRCPLLAHSLCLRSPTPASTQAAHRRPRPCTRVRPRSALQCSARPSHTGCSPGTLARPAGSDRTPRTPPSRRRTPHQGRVAHCHSAPRSDSPHCTRRHRPRCRRHTPPQGPLPHRHTLRAARANGPFPEGRCPCSAPSIQSDHPPGSRSCCATPTRP